MKPTLILVICSWLLHAETSAGIVKSIDARATHFGDVSRQLWEFAELGYKEQKSSALLRTELKSAGFTVQESVASIPTAFIASYGKGRPVIGILAEYDALAGLSQQALPERRPIQAGAPGHACGHNLFGAGSVLASIAIKEYLQTQNLSGTIRLYGTPAEEGGAGKVFMARAGVFNDVDIMLHWHPGDSNAADAGSSMANRRIKVAFHGVASHASISPDKGRSALDAVTLMNLAVEMLREHVPSETRMHYVISKGGDSPSVVPQLAESYLLIRHPSMTVLDGIYDRILKCAEGASLATETRMEVIPVGSVYNVIPNASLSQIIDRNLRRVGGIEYTAEEKQFADMLHKTLPAGSNKPGHERDIQPISTGVGSHSTDVGDVSWIVPTGGLTTATFVPGTQNHSWQAVACAGSSIGRKGMVLAAKVLALTAVDLFGNPQAIAAAKAELQTRRSGMEYRSRIAADQRPPLNYTDLK
jgi:aminobenzoyl-glutamate utilization protein B